MKVTHAGRVCSEQFFGHSAPKQRSSVLNNQPSVARWFIVVGILVSVVPSHLRILGETTYAEDAAETANENTTPRIRSGLQALYDFDSVSGPIVKDRSGIGRPVDLRISDLKSVRRSKGSLEVRGKTLIRSEKPAFKIINAVRRSGEITIEAWIRPAKTTLTGPARIVTLSKSPNERNFTLGQEKDHFEVRFRTTKTSKNGVPAVSSTKNTLSTRLTHVVYTRNRTGQTRIYINGQRNFEKQIAGTTSNWASSFRLALSNELTADRPWQGTFYLVAIYNRNLRPNEVQQNYKAGARTTSTMLAKNQLSPNARLFETEIAPLFARHCLECHDSASKKGGLDLSRKLTAIAGGESGAVLVAGKSAASLLWESIEANEMPKKRPPLSTEEKKLLRKWIDAGATWTLDVIDPAIYVHNQPTNQIWIQRLTVTEYIETVRSVVGVDIAKEARRILPRDLRADGFSNTAYNLNVDLKHVDAYAKLAGIIVERMDVAAFAKQYSRSRKLTDDNMRGLIAKMGQWLLRGPLEDHEITVYRGISTTVASTGGDFNDAVSYIVESMLQSPRFIYRIENQRGDGTAWPAGEFELASRLSYILWGGPPDKELMRAADSGELADRAHVLSQVKRMLKGPRAIKRSLQFISEWLDLDRMDNLRPDRKKYPDWNTEIANDMRTETLAFFQHVVWNQKRPLADIFNAQVTFVSSRLADHYGLTSANLSSAGAKKGRVDGFRRYDLASVRGRGGLLTQGSILTVGGDEASMVTRGLFVLHDLLRGTVKDPPPCVDTTPVPTKAGLTQRGIAEARIANAACGGCHSKFEPLAFGLEKFDGLGAFRDKDRHGNVLREDGTISFPGASKSITYKTSAELMNLLASSERVRETLTWKVTQFALGRPLGSLDARSVAKIHKASPKNGGTYAGLITAIVMSDLVQMTRTEAAE